MQTKIKIFETGIEEGIFSTNKKFYNESEDINSKFIEVRKKVATKFGFNYKRIIQALQKTDSNNISYPDGKYYIITEKDLLEDDLWDLKIPTDILILKENIKNVVVGNQMADCPILIIEDRKQGVTALSHCGASYINRKLPEQTVEALIKEFKSNPKDLYVYIGSCIKKDNYIYDRYPKWATNKDVWNNNIIEKNNDFYIDMIGAMLEQLNKFDIKNIEISKYDTSTDSIHYSHKAFSEGNEAKKGQNFVGFYYK